MEFIDHTGHIFSLPSYDKYPTGYEYETFTYMFRLEDEYVKRLSVDNYYIKPVRALISKAKCPDSSGLALDITVDSSVYKLIGSACIQEKTAAGEYNIEFSEDDPDFKQALTKDDIYLIEDNDFILVTFYIIGMATEPATWTSNILIHAEYDGVAEYCPITAAGVFYDEQEELVINGRNMGISLPKDIVSAVYGASVYTDTIDEALYNAKVKEYLMNYMRLHGEKGNIDSMKSGLKFFGWGDKVQMTQLVRTDNIIITQYIRDFFSTTNDLLARFDKFSHTGLLSLYVPVNGETGEEEHPSCTSDFWGEMKPVMEDYMSKMTEIRYDEQDITYRRRYFDYTLAELMLKVSALRYYYQKYFLPVHSLCLSASVMVQTHTNDIKYVTRPHVKMSECPVVFEADRLKQTVTFPATDEIFFSTQERYVDSNLNEFAEYVPEDKYHSAPIGEDIYYINGVCAAIPIEFATDSIDLFNCNLVLECDGAAVYESAFSFSSNARKYSAFVIYPKVMDSRTLGGWLGKDWCLHLLVNGVWYGYKFTLCVPEMQLQFGKLQYKYDGELFRQVISIDGAGDTAGVNFQTYMHQPSLVDVQNINFAGDTVSYYNDGAMGKFVSMYRESPSICDIGTPSEKYYNRCHHYALKKDGADVEYTEGQGNGMYLLLFNADGTQKEEAVKDSTAYDIYLMHDEKTWHIVAISRETVAGMSKEDLAAPAITMPGYDVIHESSDTRFLINRMEYVPADGVNRFTAADIIVGTVGNIELPFIMTHGTHWEISPFSIGGTAAAEVDSNTDMFIMSAGKGRKQYEPGYYNIKVRYSLDGTIQYQQEHRAKIFIGKD